MRTISDIELRILKSATDGAYMLSGGISRILDFTRVKTAPLSKYASFSDDNRKSFIPIDVAIEVDRRAQTPTIVKEMAALLGYELRPIGNGTVSDLGPITEMDAHRVLSEGMDVSKTILDAVADQNIDALERQKIAKEAREAIRALESVLQRLDMQR